MKVSTSSGVRLKDRIPFFAQLKFLSILLVERPNMPLRPRVRHARLTKADVGAQPAQEQVALAARQQPPYHPAIDEREIAGIVRIGTDEK